VLDKAGRAGAGVACCGIGVDGRSVGTALMLIPVERCVRWQLVLSDRGITGPLRCRAIFLV